MLVQPVWLLEEARPKARAEGASPPVAAPAPSLDEEDDFDAEIECFGCPPALEERPQWFS